MVKPLSERILERLNQENRVVPAQTKLTPRESAKLDSFVEQCIADGVCTTRSSVIRAFILEGLEAGDDGQS